MVSNIVNKVKSLERKLDKKVRDELKTSSDEIRVISTFDTDHQIVEVTKKHTSNLSLTKSFSSSNTAPNQSVVNFNSSRE